MLYSRMYGFDCHNDLWKLINITKTCINIVPLKSILSPFPNLYTYERTHEHDRFNGTIIDFIIPSGRLYVLIGHETENW